MSADCRFAFILRFSIAASMFSATLGMLSAFAEPSTAAMRSFAFRFRCGPLTATAPRTSEPAARAGVTSTFGAENSAFSVSRSTRPFACMLNLSKENSGLARSKRNAPAICRRTSTSGLLPVMRADSATSPGVCPSRRPVLTLRSATLSSCPLASSRYVICAFSIRTSASLMRGGASPFAEGLPLPPARSAKFIVPSLRRTTFARRPATLRVSTATSPESNGSVRTATSDDSSATNTWLPPASLIVVLPSAMPATGKKRTFGVPSMLTERFFSFIACSMRALTNAPSTMKTAATTAIMASTTSPPTPYRTYFRIFMRLCVPGW